MEIKNHYYSLEMVEHWTVNIVTMVANESNQLYEKQGTTIGRHGYCIEAGQNHCVQISLQSSFKRMFGVLHFPLNKRCSNASQCISKSDSFLLQSFLQDQKIICNGKSGNPFICRLTSRRLINRKLIALNWRSLSQFK